jgi:acetyltransferase-like isoleucine patch superfamily enzyme
LIETHDHSISRQSKSKWSITTASLEIADDAWLGANSVVLKSVRRIGRGAVVAAGAVVTHDVEDWAIIAGVPARRIGSVDEARP